MSQKPDTVVSDVAARKPRLLVFDDDVNQLAKYCAKLARDYTVEGVLVSFASDADAILKDAFARRDWDKASDLLEADIYRFNSAKHLVTNQTELRDLLRERQPDFVLSDLQMRPEMPQVMGTDVMRIASEELPDSRRALHTAASFARTAPVSALSNYDKKERAVLVKAMKEDGFKTFPKPTWHQPFDASPIIDHFEGRQTGRAF